MASDQLFTFVYKGGVMVAYGQNRNVFQVFILRISFLDSGLVCTALYYLVT